MLSPNGIGCTKSAQCIQVTYFQGSGCALLELWPIQCNYMPIRTGADILDPNRARICVHRFAVIINWIFLVLASWTFTEGTFLADFLFYMDLYFAEFVVVSSLLCYIFITITLVTRVRCKNHQKKAFKLRLISILARLNDFHQSRTTSNSPLRDYFFLDGCSTLFMAPSSQWEWSLRAYFQPRCSAQILPFSNSCHSDERVCTQAFLK